MDKFPSWCCQNCGVVIGWAGRALQWLPFGHRCRAVAPPARQVRLYESDPPMTRARRVFEVMGLGIRSDEVGQAMLRSAADLFAAYQRLDREAAAPDSNAKSGG